MSIAPRRKGTDDDIADAFHTGRVRAYRDGAPRALIDVTKDVASLRFWIGMEEVIDQDVAIGILSTSVYLSVRLDLYLNDRMSDQRAVRLREAIEHVTIRTVDFLHSGAKRVQVDDKCMADLKV